MLRRGGGASTAAVEGGRARRVDWRLCRVDGVPFSTVRFWEVGRYLWSLGARRRRAGSSGRTRPRARQYKTVERRKPGYSIAWRTLAADQVRIAESAELPNTWQELSSCVPRRKSGALRHFRSCSVSQRDAAVFFQCFCVGGVSGPGDSCPSRDLFPRRRASAGPLDRSALSTGRVSSPAAHWIGCSMSGAAGPLSACLHRRDSTRCDHAAAAAATNPYPL